MGFRVIAYARGGLEANALLIGIGVLATAVTVTLLYALLVGVWRIRFGRARGVAYGGLMIAAGVCLLVMYFP